MARHVFKMYFKCPVNNWKCGPGWSLVKDWRCSWEKLALEVMWYIYSSGSSKKLHINGHKSQEMLISMFKWQADSHKWVISIQQMFGHLLGRRYCVRDCLASVVTINKYRTRMYLDLLYRTKMYPGLLWSVYDKSPEVAIIPIWLLVHYKPSLVLDLHNWIPSFY